MGNPENMTFDGHLYVLRKMMMRRTISICILTILIFYFKEYVWNIILAPSSSNFIFFRVLHKIIILYSPNEQMEIFSVKLINTELSSQFMVHLSTSFYIGLLLDSPHIFMEFFLFVKPALYKNEIKSTIFLTIIGYLLFLFGILLNYFIIFPMCFRFLSSYQVSTSILNMINLSSYVSTFITLSLAMGLVFETPIIAFFSAKIGIISADFLKEYRKWAVVIITILSAIITPPDVFSCFMMMIPLLILYEFSIIIVSHVERKQP